MDNEFFENLKPDDVRAWVEQETIHLKAASANGDPVELTATEASKLAEILNRLAESIGA